MNSDDFSYNLTNTLLFHLEQTARVSRISAMHYFEENPNISISYNVFSIIDAIYLNPEIHQRDLAKLLLKDTANLSRDLEKLEKSGYVVRTVDLKANRIVKKILLTEKGLELHKSISCLAGAHVEHIESVFNLEEKEVFKEFLTRLKNNL